MQLFGPPLDGGRDGLEAILSVAEVIERMASERMASERMASERMASERMGAVWLRSCSPAAAQKAEEMLLQGHRQVPEL
jgi:hypothetical protein